MRAQTTFHRLHLSISQYIWSPCDVTDLVFSSYVCKQCVAEGIYER